jgi:hypothetical protein
VSFVEIEELLCRLRVKEYPPGTLMLEVSRPAGGGVVMLNLGGARTTLEFAEASALAGALNALLEEHHRELRRK